MPAAISSADSDALQVLRRIEEALVVYGEGGVDGGAIHFVAGAGEADRILPKLRFPLPDLVIRGSDAKFLVAHFGPVGYVESQSRLANLVFLGQRDQLTNKVFGERRIQFEVGIGDAKVIRQRAQILRVEEYIMWTLVLFQADDGKIGTARRQIVEQRRKGRSVVDRDDLFETKAA